MIKDYVLHDVLTTNHRGAKRPVFFAVTIPKENMMRYYPNGKPKARIHFVDGMRGGLKGEMFWDEKGRQVKN